MDWALDELLSTLDAPPAASAASGSVAKTKVSSVPPSLPTTKTTSTGNNSNNNYLHPSFDDVADDYMDELDKLLSDDHTTTATTKSSKTVAVSKQKTVEPIILELAPPPLPPPLSLPPPPPIVVKVEEPVQKVTKVPEPEKIPIPPGCPSPEEAMLRLSPLLLPPLLLPPLLPSSPTSPSLPLTPPLVLPPPDEYRDEVEEPPPAPVEEPPSALKLPLVPPLFTIQELKPTTLTTTTTTTLSLSQQLLMSSKPWTLGGRRDPLAGPVSPPPVTPASLDIVKLPLQSSNSTTVKSSQNSQQQFEVKKPSSLTIEAIGTTSSRISSSSSSGTINTSSGTINTSNGKLNISQLLMSQTTVVDSLKNLKNGGTLKKKNQLPPLMMPQEKRIKIEHLSDSGPPPAALLLSQSPAPRISFPPSLLTNSIKQEASNLLSSLTPSPLVANALNNNNNTITSKPPFDVVAQLGILTPYSPSSLPQVSPRPPQLTTTIATSVMLPPTPTPCIAQATTPSSTANSNASLFLNPSPSPSSSCHSGQGSTYSSRARDVDLDSGIESIDSLSPPDYRTATLGSLKPPPYVATAIAPPPPSSVLTSLLATEPEPTKSSTLLTSLLNSQPTSSFPAVLTNALTDSQQQGLLPVASPVSTASSGVNVNNTAEKSVATEPGASSSCPSSSPTPSSNNLALTLKPVVKPPTKKKINVIAINPNDLTLTKENREFKIEAAMDVTVDLGEDNGESVTLAEFLGDVPIRSALEDFDKNQEGNNKEAVSRKPPTATPALHPAPVQFLLSPVTPIPDSNATSPIPVASACSSASSSTSSTCTSSSSSSSPSSSSTPLTVVAALSKEDAATRALSKELESVVTSAMAAGKRSLESSSKICNPESNVTTGRLLNIN